MTIRGLVRNLACQRLDEFLNRASLDFGECDAIVTEIYYVAIRRLVIFVDCFECEDVKQELEQLGVEMFFVRGIAELGFNSLHSIHHMVTNIFVPSAAL